MYAPKLHTEYQETMRALYEKHKKRYRVKPLFIYSAFPAATCNFGPRAITSFHKDFKNKASGLLALTSFGDFDPTRGGHIVLKDLKLIIQFPPGSTILFLSCVLEHANLPVADHEFRFSFVQYAAGGLFRWKEYNFQLQDKMKKKNPEIEARLLQGESTAWEREVAKLSMLDDLKLDHAKLS